MEEKKKQKDLQVVDPKPEESEETQSDPRSHLILDEREELERYEKLVLSQDPRRTLAASTARTFFELFLNGLSTKEIHAQNKAFPWGMIIHARVKFNWDEEREIYMRDLFVGIRQKLTKVQMEGVHFLSDLLSATHKNMGNKLRKYLQTGDEKLIKDINLTSINNYGRAIALLAKLTGQEKELGPLRVLLEDNTTGKPTVIDAAVVDPINQPLAPSTTKLLPAGVAANIVEMLLDKEKSKK